MKKNYEYERILFNKLKENIVIPKFQRRLVWSKEKKEKFINTILSGDPCGVFLICKTDEGKYSLVDGLQRYSTLIDFIEHPAKYIDIDRQYSKKIDDIIYNFSHLNGDLGVFRKTIIDIIEKNFKIGVPVTDTAKAVLEQLPIFKENSEAYINLLDLLANMEHDFNMSDFIIETIIYNGDFNNLPEIFANMNSNGTQLSKYDVFAALWYNHRMFVQNDEILNAIEQKYNDMMKNSDIEIDSYESGSIFDEKEINLYEFCISLSRVLHSNFPELFPITGNNYSKYDSFGFNLVAAILTGKPQNKNKLPNYFKDVTDIDINNFVEGIKNSTKKLLCLLKPYIILSNGEVLHKYIESQMVCMIATIFKMNYSYSGTGILFERRRPNKNELISLDKNLPKRYLYDIITNHWGNSGDKKTAIELQKEINDNRFLTPITIQYWKINIDEWLKGQEDVNNKQIPIENKLFINYIRVMHNYKVDESDMDWVIDCIIPKEKIYKYLKGCTGKHSVMNLAYIPIISHKNKKINDGKTLFELSWNGKNDICLLDKILYPQETDLCFIINKDKVQEKEWIQYLKSRRNYIVNLFCQSIKTN